jgi:hypothetical protein
MRALRGKNCRKCYYKIDVGYVRKVENRDKYERAELSVDIYVVENTGWYIGIVYAV